MAQVQLIRGDGKVFNRRGTSAVIIALTRPDPNKAAAGINIHWDIVDRAEFVTIGVDFLKALEQAGGGVIENVLARYLQESGKLQNGIAHIVHKEKKGQ